MIYSATAPAYHKTLDDLDHVVRAALEELRPLADRFDSIVVTGTSGIVVGSPVSMMLEKPLVIVRKENDGSHDGDIVVNWKRAGRRLLFLDDFACSGNTEKRVVESLASWLRQPHALVGRYFYHGTSMWDAVLGDYLHHATLMWYPAGPHWSVENKYPPSAYKVTDEVPF